jgi:anti-sigma factor RsiW
VSSCDRFEREGLLQLERGHDLGDHFQRCPDCLAARAAYDRLRQELAGAGSGYEPPADWQVRVRAAIAQRRRPPRPWWSRLLIPAGVAAAGAAAVLVIVVREPEPEPVVALHVGIEAAAEVTRRGGEAHPGDRLQLEAHTAGARHAELRVYRHDAELVMRCSTEPPCVRDGDRLRAALRLEALGSYRSVLLVSDRPFPPPAAGLDRDVGAALETGAQAYLGEEVRVR